MRIASNKVEDIISFFHSELAELYAKVEIDLFIKYCLEDFAGIPPHKILFNKVLTVSESQLLKLNFAVKDLKKYKPIQYIVGTTFFYGLKFNVNENVLIPRPETEELVDLILKENSSLTSCLNVLDIGTGSGCIPIALKKNRSNWNVSAMDISKNALAVAEKNASFNDVLITFMEDDILDENITTRFHKKFDIIVSNPPYVKVSEKKQMAENVLQYEPHLALFVDDLDPLLFYKNILSFAQKMLNNNGKIYLEINEELGLETRDLMMKEGFKNIVLIKDINNKNRILQGVLYY